MMNITVQDSSSYFKGLLILIRKDRKISKAEYELMFQTGTRLGFDKDFIEESIGEILYNMHIVLKPPVFSTRELAEKFIKDGLIIAASDGEIHDDEEKWLLETAEKNSIDKEWFYVEKRLVANSKNEISKLEVDNLKVVY